MVNKAIKKMVNDSLQNKKYENMKTEKMNQRDIQNQEMLGSCVLVHKHVNG